MRLPFYKISFSILIFSLMSGFGCICDIPNTPAEVMDRDDIIMMGTVIKVSEGSDTVHMGELIKTMKTKDSSTLEMFNSFNHLVHHYTEVTFRFTKIIKGRPRGKTVVFKMFQNSSCSQRYDLIKPKKQFLISGRQSDGKSHYVNSLCSLFKEI